MSLKERITEDMKAAMRSGDKERLGHIRMLQAAIKQREVVERDALVDLAAKESAEIALLQAYLPEQLSPAELEALVAAAIAETGATTIKDMGKVMGLVKGRAAGRADMGAVGALIKSKLASG